MPDLSTIQVHYSETYTVDAEGNPATLLSRTEPRWTETESNTSFAEWASVVEYLHLPVTAPPPVAEALGIGEYQSAEVLDADE